MDHGRCSLVSRLIFQCIHWENIAGSCLITCDKYYCPKSSKISKVLCYQAWDFEIWLKIRWSCSSGIYWNIMTKSLLRRILPARTTMTHPTLGALFTASESSVRWWLGASRLYFPIAWQQDTTNKLRQMMHTHEKCHWNAETSYFMSIFKMCPSPSNAFCRCTCICHCQDTDAPLAVVDVDLNRKAPILHRRFHKHRPADEAWTA